MFACMLLVSLHCVNMSDILICKHQTLSRMQWSRSNYNYNYNQIKKQY